MLETAVFHIMKKCSCYSLEFDIESCTEKFIVSILPISVCSMEYKSKNINHLFV